jgi:Phosphatidylethanolamine-binding protein
MMVLSSSAFEDAQEIPQRHGKKIANVSPRLSWKDAPSGTRSFALAMVDRHPVAGNYLHWLVVDIDAGATSLTEAASGAAMPPDRARGSPMPGPSRRRARTTTSSPCTRLGQTGLGYRSTFPWTRSPKRWSLMPWPRRSWLGRSPRSGRSDRPRCVLPTPSPARHLLRRHPRRGRCGLAAAGHLAQRLGIEQAVDALIDLGERAGAHRRAAASC